MESSCTIWVATTRKPSFFRNSATAGPERSTRSPCAQESLTVTTAAVSTAGHGCPCDDASTVEEDIYFLFPPAATARAASDGTSCAWTSTGTGANATFFNGGCDGRLAAAIALRFVEQAQSLHQKALSIEFCGFLIGLAFEVEFEVAAGPAQNFEDGLVS